MGQTSKSSSANGMVLDASGNIFITGSTTGYLPSCSGQSSLCSGNAQNASGDYYISKYSSSGAWQWTAQLGSAAGAIGSSTIGIGVDSSGNVYVGGSTGADLTTCNGVSANCAGASVGATDYFISKYSSSGSWQWTRQLGSAGYFTFVYGLSVDSSGNTYITGSTQAELVSCGGVSASCSGAGSLGTRDAYISKYNSSGTFQWTVQLGGNVRTESFAVAVDSSGNVFNGGGVRSNLVACGGVSCAGGAAQGTPDDYFINKYNSAGVWQWTVQLGETAVSTTIKGLAIDSSGNVYGSGTTAGNLPSCGGVSAACAGASQGTVDYFISKYTSASAWQWTVQLGETATSVTMSSSSGPKLISDSSSNIILTSTTNGDLASCNGVSASCAGSSRGATDFFFSKYTSSGVWLSTTQLGQTSKTTSGYAVATNSLGNVYIAGSTNGNLTTCGGVSANCTGNSQGTTDYFIYKY